MEKYSAVRLDDIVYRIDVADPENRQEALAAWIDDLLREGKDPKMQMMHFCRREGGGWFWMIVLETSID